METDGKKLIEYVSMNQRFWSWPSNEFHAVVFLGFEMTEFEFKSGNKVPTVRYYFQLANGTEKPCDIRSLTFAGMMAQFKSGDQLKIRRNKLPNGKYAYEAFKNE